MSHSLCDNCRDKDKIDVEDGAEEGGNGPDKEGLVEKVVERISPNQVKIFEAIEENSTVSAGELAGVSGISIRKTQENIAKLKELGILKRIGPDKGGYWEVVERGV